MIAAIKSAVKICDLVTVYVPFKTFSTFFTCLPTILLYICVLVLNYLSCGIVMFSY